MKKKKRQELYNSRHNKIFSEKSSHSSPRSWAKPCEVVLIVWRDPEGPVRRCCVNLFNLGIYLEHLFTRQKHHLVEFRCPNRLQGTKRQSSSLFSLPGSPARGLTVFEPVSVRTFRALRESGLEVRAAEGICLQGCSVSHLWRPQPFPWASSTGCDRLFKPTRVRSANVLPEEDRRNTESKILNRKISLSWWQHEGENPAEHRGPQANCTQLTFSPRLLAHRPLQTVLGGRVFRLFPPCTLMYG